MYLATALAISANSSSDDTMSSRFQVACIFSSSLDLTKTATTDAFEQIVDTIEYATAEDGFPQLAQNDINGTGTQYQIVVCVVSLGTGGITGILSQIKQASAIPDDVFLSKCVAVTTTGTDLNDYTQEGWYFFASTYKPTNIPVGVNGWLHVLNNTVGSNTYIKQLWYRAGTPGTNDFHSYVRTYTTAGGWSAWSKYITENDAVRIVKLWENASPSSTFAAQTLSLDLSGYDAVMIFFHNASDSTIYLSTGMIPIGYKTTLAYTTTSGAIYSRPATASSTGIVFEAGQTGTTSGAKYCVPVHIYGIKGVA